MALGAKERQLVYGPVPSRRLGRSLGVDLVPFKTCTYDCIYCQLGRTTCKTIRRRRWVDPATVMEQVRAKLETEPDAIALAGSGEPTLASTRRRACRLPKQRGEIMKIAVSAQGNDRDSLVDPRFGRCRWLIVYDTESHEWQSYENISGDGSGGAGIQTGTWVVSLGAEAVISGNVGPNALRVMGAAGVAAYQVGNGITVDAALNAFQSGELVPLDVPTVSGHWA